MCWFGKEWCWLRGGVACLRGGGNDEERAHIAEDVLVNFVPDLRWQIREGDGTALEWRLVVAVVFCSRGPVRLFRTVVNRSRDNVTLQMQCFHCRHCTGLPSGSASTARDVCEDAAGLGIEANNKVKTSKPYDA